MLVFWRLSVFRGSGNQKKDQDSPPTEYLEIYTHRKTTFLFVFELDQNHSQNVLFICKSVAVHSSAFTFNNLHLNTPGLLDCILLRSPNKSLKELKFQCESMVFCASKKSHQEKPQNILHGDLFPPAFSLCAKRLMSC